MGSDPTRVSLAQIATELAIPEKRARRLLSTNGWWLNAHPRTKRGRTTYDAVVIEKLRALLGQEHRQLEPPESDWLSNYLKENRNARNQGPT